MVSPDHLSAELVLRILHHLDKAQDVVRFGQVNRRMQILSRDPILWKRLFIQTFLLQNEFDKKSVEASSSSKRLRMRENHITTSREENKQLSARNLTYLPSLQGDDDRRTDWYSLFRISRNWQVGSFSVQQLNQALKKAQFPTDAQSESFPPDFDLPNTIIESTQEFVFTASRKSSSIKDQGQVMVFSTDNLGALHETNDEDILQESLTNFISPSLDTSTKANSDISALAIDRTGSTYRSINLLVAYSNGLLSIARFDKSSKQCNEIASSSFKSYMPIAMMTFSWPYFATCSTDFRIRIYRISENDDILDNAKYKLSMVEERRSYSCHWPACMRLDTAKKCSDTIRLSIAYSNHVYPKGWTVGLQEIYMKDGRIIDSRSASAKRSHVVTGLDDPKKRTDSKAKLRERKHTDQVKSLTSLSYEEPFVVVGSRDHGVFCFRVDGLSDELQSTKQAPSNPLSIHHIRTLYGHTGSVHSVSLDGGRCISGGSDGSVRVWRLGDEELSIARATGVIAMMRGRLQSSLGKVISLRSSDGFNENPYSNGKKRKHSSIDETSNGSNRPLTLAEIWRHHTVSSMSTSSSFRSSNVIRWVASAFDRIISVTSVQPQSPPSSSSAKNLISASSCSREVQQELPEDEELVQIWNFA